LFSGSLNIQTILVLFLLDLVLMRKWAFADLIFPYKALGALGPQYMALKTKLAPVLSIKTFAEPFAGPRLGWFWNDREQ